MTKRVQIIDQKKFLAVVLALNKEVDDICDLFRGKNVDLLSLKSPSVFVVG